VIEVEQLNKIFQVPVREPGFAAAWRSLWDRRTRDVHAVRDVSFTVQPGERVGFLGPNGAGKTTTLKMLTGLLHPTSGQARVLGHRPAERPRALLTRIAMVMGQKNGLLWDLPPTETFAMHRALYDLSAPAFHDALDELTRLLDLRSFLDRPVRSLSLGQRMRCELAAALLHRPAVLFLDEPTIGLDVEAQEIVRAFLGAYNRQHRATIVLTSHDMGDVAALCERVLLIDQGELRFDGPLAELARRFGPGRRLVVRAPGLDLSAEGFSRVSAAATGGAKTGDAASDAPSATAGEDASTGDWVVLDEPAAINQRLVRVLTLAPSADVTVSDPPLEDVLRRAFDVHRQESP
jgi:ABC-2 type transport system ATP-binding protein